MKVTKTYLQQELTKAQNELKGHSSDYQRLALEYEKVQREKYALTLSLEQTQKNLETASDLIHQSNAALFTLIEKMPTSPHVERSTRLSELLATNSAYGKFGTNK